MPRVHGHAILHDPVVHHILAGQQRIAVRRTHRAARNDIAGIDAFAEKAVNVGRFDIGIAGVAQGAGPPLITKDKEQVGFTHVSLQSALPHSCRAPANAQVNH